MKKEQYISAITAMFLSVSEVISNHLIPSQREAVRLLIDRHITVGHTLSCEFFVS